MVDDIANGRHCAAYVGDSALAIKLITWTTVYAIALKQSLHYSRDMSEVLLPSQYQSTLVVIDQLQTGL